MSKSKNFKQGQGVKGRNEPADVSRRKLCPDEVTDHPYSQVTAVAYVVAQAMGLPVEQVARAAWENTVRVFFPHRKDWL